jgi:hypothetical protein
MRPASRTRRTGGISYPGADRNGAPDSDESGLEPGTGVLLPHAVVLGHVAFYATGKVTDTPTEAVETVIHDPSTDCPPPGRVTARGTCCTDTGLPGGHASKAPAKVVDLNTLGLTPPFHVETR